MYIHTLKLYDTCNLFIVWQLQFKMDRLEIFVDSSTIKTLLTDVKLYIQYIYLQFDKSC